MCLATWAYLNETFGDPWVRRRMPGLLNFEACVFTLALIFAPGIFLVAAAAWRGQTTTWAVVADLSLIVVYYLMLLPAVS